MVITLNNKYRSQGKKTAKNIFIIIILKNAIINYLALLLQLLLHQDN